MRPLRNKNKINKDDKSLWNCLETNFKNLDGDEFEKIIAELYRKRGFHVVKTPKGPDQGIDLIARRGKTKIIIQAKNLTGKVGSKVIRETAGSKYMVNAKYAQVITSSNFTKDATEALRKIPRIRGMAIRGLKNEFRKYYRIKKPEKKSQLDKIKERIFGKKTTRTVKRQVRRKSTRNRKSFRNN